ncbi:TolC family protein [Spirosoma montaniterrae]|nr:TolC family protein [Spirosoma montaniterrae]
MNVQRIFSIAGGWLMGLWLAAAGPANAQTRLSLNDAIALGLANRYDARANTIDVSLAENTVQQRRNDWIPDLNLSGNLRYNTQLQKTVLPAGAFGNTEPQTVAFGTRNNTALSLDLTQPLYRPDLKTDRQIAANTVALEKEKLSQRQTNLKVQIAEAYLNVLLRELQQTTARAEADRYQTYLTIAEGNYKLGTLLESDYLSTRLDYQNANVSARKAEQNYQLALINLRYQLNLPDTTAVELTDKLDPATLTRELPTADGFVQRTEIRQLQLQQTENNLRTQRVLDGLKPNLSVYGNYSTQFQDNSFNYGNSNAWTNFNYVGLKVNVPLSAQFKKRSDLQTYKLRTQQTALNLQQTQADIAYEVQRTRTELANASQNLQTTQASLDLSKQVYQTRQNKYRLGSVLYSAVLDTEKSLQTAEQNYLEAAYAYLVARLNYEKAIGRY